MTLSRIFSTLHIPHKSYLAGPPRTLGGSSPPFLDLVPGLRLHLSGHSLPQTWRGPADQREDGQRRRSQRLGRLNTRGSCMAGPGARDAWSPSHGPTSHDQLCVREGSPEAELATVHFQPSGQVDPRGGGGRDLQTACSSKGEHCRTPRTAETNPGCGRGEATSAATKHRARPQLCLHTA